MQSFKKGNTVGAIITYFLCSFLFLGVAAWATGNLYLKLVSVFHFDKNWTLLVERILRYILVIWFVCYLNKKWIKQPLCFSNWKWKWDVIVISLIFIVCFWYNFPTIKNNWSLTSMPNLLYTIGPAILEEIICRGVVLGALIKCFQRYKYGTIMALILSAVLFAAGHLINTSLSFVEVMLNVLDALTMGLVVGGVYIRTRNLFLPMLLHFVSDFAAYFFDITFMTALDANSIIIQFIVGIIVTLFLLRKYWCPGYGIIK